MPWGCSDDILPWDGTPENEHENKRLYMVRFISTEVKSVCIHDDLKIRMLYVILCIV